MEENENEKETESGKNKEKRTKKPKKKDKVKDPEDPQKTKKTTKKDRKRNLHLQQTNVPKTVYTFTHTKASWRLVIAEKNLEVSIHQTESVSEMKSLEKDECEDSGQEEEDKSKSPPTQSPQRKRQLDICEP